MRKYDLSGGKSRIERDVIFIERNINFLRDGGRMAIILPQGIFNNMSTEYIRQFIFSKARLLAVISLNANTFRPHTGVKTSVLFIQKWDDKINPKKDDYNIFFAISNKSGKDNSGSYLFSKDKDGTTLLDEHGHPQIEHDLNKISKDFNIFAKKEKLSFV